MPSAPNDACSLPLRSRLCECASWKTLLAHHRSAGPVDLRAAFATEPGRATRCTASGAGWTLDWSKQLMQPGTMPLLLALARERQVPERFAAMLGGARLNWTEGRSVLHTALRAPVSSSIPLDGHDVVPGVHDTLRRMEHFSNAVRVGQWTGATGKRIRHVINIGIGGSDLGPAMAYQALQPWRTRELDCRFVSNVDGNDLAIALGGIDPEETLFIVCSKTFTTQETMENAGTARAWLVSALGEAAVGKHFVAVSTNLEKVRSFGIDPDHMFGFWDWVGGRYSMDSAIGLSTMVAVGPDHFHEMLGGFRAMDEHARMSPLESNVPVLMGMIGVWNASVLGLPALAVLPYDQLLARFPAYLQQLLMESNGKRVDDHGDTVSWPTCPVVFGEAGTNGQHAFYQMLHQGTTVVPIDFICFRTAAHPIGRHRMLLNANAIAQAQAFAFGHTADEVRAQGTKDALVPHRSFPGNRPSSFLWSPALTPASFGALIALYEHSTFVQGIVWGINSFDQWGVELGKSLAVDVIKGLEDASAASTHDSSTDALIRALRANSV
ncbi:MAG: glucose-6-phosphate isomerase [Phycisphaerae bacterium]|nr:glucose-6-phosphate isomerase [Phycisphaerae bacterium]